MGMFLSLAPRITTVTDPTFVTGYLDAATITGVSGWAGPGPTHVTVTVNGTLVATVLTDQARPDVLAATLNGTQPYANYGVCGFSYSFSPILDATQNQTVVVACQGTTLNNGTKTVTGGGGGGGTSGYITDMALQPGAVVQQGIAATMPNNDTELASHPSVIFYEPMDTTAGVKSRWNGADKFYGPGPNGLPSIDNPSVFTTDSKTGCRLLQIPIQAPLNAGDGIGGTGCSWHHPIVDQTTQELYCRYLVVVETDVQATYDSNGTQINGITESGVKLPGLGGAYENAGQWNYNGNNITQLGGWHARLWHAAPVANQIYPFRWYLYDWQEYEVEALGGAATYPLGNAAARGGQVYCLEQRIKLNTLTGVNVSTGLGTPVADGILEAWVDGVKVYSDTARKIRANTQANFEELFANIFHGGHLAPIGRITYRIGAYCIATQYIGPPKSVVHNYRTSASDAFFNSLVINQWTDIPGTAMMTNIIPQIRSDYLEYGAYSGYQPSPGVPSAPGPINVGGLAGILDWSGGSWDNDGGDFWGIGGGHNSTNNNMLYKFSPELAAGGSAASTYRGWLVAMQPSVYTPSDFDVWHAAQGGDIHYEIGYGYPNDNGTWKDGKPTSRHTYGDPTWVSKLGALVHGQTKATPDSFWVRRPDGTYSQIPGGAFFGNSSVAYLQGNRVEDKVNNVLLSFVNWPNGASIGVRRFNLATNTDMPAIDLTNQVLSQDSNWTAGLYYTETTWCQTGWGCMVGREFHYAMSEGSLRYFRVNVDTWVAKELTLSRPSRIGTMLYAADTGKLYALSCDNALLMSGDPFTGVWQYVTTTGTWNVTTQMVQNGIRGRFFYYSARKCLVAITDVTANVQVLRIA